MPASFFCYYGGILVTIFAFENPFQDSICPHLSQKLWYSVSKDILHLGQTGYAFMFLYTNISVTVMGSLYISFSSVVSCFFFNIFYVFLYIVFCEQFTCGKSCICG